MENDATRPIESCLVRYRCSCGADLQLDSAVGGRCFHCQKEISPKLLGHELAMTMTMRDGSFELGQTQVQVELVGSETIDGRQAKVEPGSENPDIMIGEKFGHFELISTLGRGGMGQVYRALDTSLQRYVAVKLLRSGIGSSRGLTRSSDHEVDKLLQEAVSQARVTHPNIVTIYYVGKQDDDPFLAMELVNGQPLNRRIAVGNISFNEICEIATQIAEALKFSFELDIIHGDIKPSNVLLQPNGVAKLSDFGMARRASQDNDDSIGGTPNYIAPELLRGEKPSIQSDIYALGVTLYEMSFGQLPVTLTGKTIPDWIAIHEASNLMFPSPWPDRLPEAWQELLGKTLAKNPAQRYGGYDELIKDLKQLSPGSQVVARIFPRLVAASIDWISVLTLAIAVGFALRFSSVEQLLAGIPGLTLMMNVFDVLPIFIYTTVIYFWRQSAGRSLMHVRVVNRYGLTPGANQMMLRSLFRMQFPWMALCFSFIHEPTQSWYGIATIVLMVLSTILLLVDISCMAILGKGRSLHDLALDTRVVLDTRS